MANYTLPRSERLRSLKAIRRLFGEGHSGFVYPFRYVWIADRRAGEAEGRGIEAMFSVPKKFHKRANKRNLLKRRTREAYRLNREALSQAVAEKDVTLDIAFVYSTKECHSHKTITNALQRILEQVCEHL
ncbi:MAG: ribonuclease P protein component [Alistipes sp.]|nr:ribonuclease P [Rikenellaceae bacterium]MBO5044587.1 ribonuclease P protein component [Alistipes sp.]MBO5276796.1 ribonuclease P protein component [Alistipes sp.]